MGIDLYPHTFPIEVENFEYGFLICRLVQANIAHFFQ